MFRARSKFFTRLQPPHKKTHPFPLRLLPRQMKEFAALSRRQLDRMEEKATFAHVFPRIMASARVWRGKIV